VPDPHDRAFFDEMQTRREPMRRLAECIHEVVGRQETALDIGCGLGAVTKRLAELGWGVLGLDGTTLARQLAEIDVTHFDLGAPSEPVVRAHCVVCTETAEHLPESVSDIIVHNVSRRARDVIVFSAAQPGQEWPGHVNLKPIAWWLARFWMAGWRPDWGATRRLQALMRARRAQHEYCAANFHVLRPRRRG
jgi:SAM-dependent methyltransferase